MPLVFNPHPRPISLKAPAKGKGSAIQRLDLAPLQTGEVTDEFVKALNAAGKAIFDTLVPPDSKEAAAAKAQAKQDSLMAAAAADAKAIAGPVPQFPVAKIRSVVAGQRNSGVHFGDPTFAPA